MRVYLLVVLVVLVDVGIGQRCGPGTVLDRDSDRCVPVSNTDRCGPGTVHDPVSDLCVLEGDEPPAIETENSDLVFTVTNGHRVGYRVGDGDTEYFNALNPALAINAMALGYNLAGGVTRTAAEALRGELEEQVAALQEQIEGGVAEAVSALQAELPGIEDALAGHTSAISDLQTLTDPLRSAGAGEMVTQQRGALHRLDSPVSDGSIAQRRSG